MFPDVYPYSHYPGFWEYLWRVLYKPDVLGLMIFFIFFLVLGRMWERDSG